MRFGLYRGELLCELPIPWQMIAWFNGKPIHVIRGDTERGFVDVWMRDDGRIQSICSACELNRYRIHRLWGKVELNLG